MYFISPIWSRRPTPIIQSIIYTSYFISTLRSSCPSLTVIRWPRWRCTQASHCPAGTSLWLLTIGHRSSKAQMEVLWLIVKLAGDVEVWTEVLSLIVDRKAGRHWSIRPFQSLCKTKIQSLMPCGVWYIGCWVYPCSLGMTVGLTSLLILVQNYYIYRLLLDKQQLFYLCMCMTQCGQFISMCTGGMVDKVE